ncbi:hypothetical protein, partial [Oleiphilus sp. HI0125]|uniref:hypothetical protein n=2 Tax=Oleiphilus sp. HI0125 TaxID=1822266 RepID=UPI0012E79EC8
MDKWQKFSDAAKRILGEFALAYGTGVISNSTNAEVRDELKSILRSIDKLQSKLTFVGKGDGYKGLHLIEHLMLARANRKMSIGRGLEDSAMPLETGAIYEESVLEWNKLKEQLRDHRELFELAIANCDQPVQGAKPQIRELSRFEKMVFEQYVEIFSSKPALHDISKFILILEDIYPSLGLEGSGLLHRYKRFV